MFRASIPAVLVAGFEVAALSQATSQNQRYLRKMEHLTEFLLVEFLWEQELLLRGEEVQQEACISLSP